MADRSSTSLIVALANRLKAQRRRHRKLLERCRREFSESAVHDLRIESRRVLAMFDLLRALHLPGRLRKTRKVLKNRLDAFDDQATLKGRRFGPEKY